MERDSVMIRRKTLVDIEMDADSDYDHVEDETRVEAIKNNQMKHGNYEEPERIKVNSR